MAFFLAKGTQYLHPVPHPASRGCAMWVMPATVWTSEDRDASVEFGHTLCGQPWILSARRTGGAGSEAIGEEHSWRGVTYSCRGQREGTEACGGHGVWLWVWGLGALGGVGGTFCCTTLAPFPTGSPTNENISTYWDCGYPCPNCPNCQHPELPPWPALLTIITDCVMVPVRGSAAQGRARPRGCSQGLAWCQAGRGPPQETLSERWSRQPGECPPACRSGWDCAAETRWSGECPPACWSRWDCAAESRRSGGPSWTLPEEVAPGKDSVVLWRGRGFWEQKSQGKGKQCERRTLRESRREAYVLLPVLLLLLSHRLTLLLSKKSGVLGRDREKHTRKKAGAAFHFRPYKSGGSEPESFFLSPSFKDINKPKP